MALQPYRPSSSVDDLAMRKQSTVPPLKNIESTLYLLIAASITRTSPYHQGCDRLFYLPCPVEGRWPMNFLHNPFIKDVDLNTILYRITYPEYFEDLDFADEEAPAAEEVIFGHDRDLEARLTWSYGVDCWRAIYAELDQAKAQVEKETCESGLACEESIQLRDELQKRLDLCLRAKNGLESAAEDARQGKSIDQLILAEKSLPPGSKIYFRKTSVAHWSVQAYDISIPEWSEDQCGKTQRLAGEYDITSLWARFW